MQRVRIEVTSRAGLRDRNRLREHGTEARLQRTGTPMCMDGHDSHLLFFDDGWFGWFSASSIQLFPMTNDQEA